MRKTASPIVSLDKKSAICYYIVRLKHSAEDGQHNNERSLTMPCDKKHIRYFDGYNTVVQYRRSEGLELVRYIKDALYCGDSKEVFAVRLASSLEDIKGFATFAEARAYYDKCASIVSEKGLRQLIPTLFPSL